MSETRIQVPSWTLYDEDVAWIDHHARLADARIIENDRPFEGRYTFCPPWQPSVLLPWWRHAGLSGGHVETNGKPT